MWIEVNPTNPKQGLKGSTVFWGLIYSFIYSSGALKSRLSNSSSQIMIHETHKPFHLLPYFQSGFFFLFLDADSKPTVSNTIVSVNRLTKTSNLRCPSTHIVPSHHYNTHLFVSIYSILPITTT